VVLALLVLLAGDGRVAEIISEGFSVTALAVLLALLIGDLGLT
jgi:hypothetical protein